MRLTTEYFIVFKALTISSFPLETTKIVRSLVQEEKEKKAFGTHISIYLSA